MQPGSPRARERWEDPSKRGNCLCYPSDADSAAALKKLGLKGIEYINGVPQFGPVSIGTVEIDQMTSERKNTGRPGKLPKFEDIMNDPNVKNPFREYLSQMIVAYYDVGMLGNFAQADIMLAEQWSNENRDGHFWTPKDVQNYREKNQLTWHECSDMRTMMLVPTCIHKDFDHYGGVNTRNIADTATAKWMEENGYTDDSTRFGRTLGASTLELIITVFILIGFVFTYLKCGMGGLLNLLLWLTTSVSPYVIVLILCLKLKGLPQILRNKTGGWTLLILFLILLILTPLLAMLMFFVYLVAAVLVFLKGADIFGPSGILTITLVEADGSTSQETRAVYGDMETAVDQAEQEFKDKGYSDFHRD